MTWAESQRFIEEILKTTLVSYYTCDSCETMFVEAEINDDRTPPYHYPPSKHSGCQGNYLKTVPHQISLFANIVDDFGNNPAKLKEAILAQQELDKILPRK